MESLFDKVIVIITIKLLFFFCHVTKKKKFDYSRGWLGNPQIHLAVSFSTSIQLGFFKLLFRLSVQYFWHKVAAVGEKAQMSEAQVRGGAGGQDAGERVGPHLNAMTISHSS